LRNILEINGLRESWGLACFGTRSALGIDVERKAKKEVPRRVTMAITKKSLIGKTSAKNSSKNKTASASAASSPVTPGKMVPAMRMATAKLQTAKLETAKLQTAKLQTGMMARF
jgi:hypothetical protein